MTGVRPTTPIIRPARSPIQGLLDALQTYGENRRAEETLKLRQQQTAAQIAQAQAQTAALTASTEQAGRAAKGQEAAARAIQELMDGGNDVSKWTAENASQWFNTFANVIAKIKQPEGVMAFIQAVPGIAEAFGSFQAVAKGQNELQLSDLTLKERLKGHQLIMDFLDNPDAEFDFSDMRQGQLFVASALGLQNVMTAGLQSLTERARFNTQRDMMARQTIMEAWNAATSRFATEMENYNTGFQARPPNLRAIIDETAREMLGITGAQLRKVAQAGVRGLGIDIENVDPETGTGQLQLMSIMPEDVQEGLMQFEEGTRQDILDTAFLYAQGNMTLEELNMRGMAQYGTSWPLIRSRVLNAAEAIKEAAKGGEPSPEFKSLFQKVVGFLSNQPVQPTGGKPAGSRGSTAGQFR